jgi:hypothetical protein
MDRPTLRGLVDRAFRPMARMWHSDEPLDAYGLVHLASAAGDALVAVSLAESVFFSLPVGQARTRVALYLALTMAPLAAAAPALIPLLDRGSFRRAISFAAAAGRAAVALYAAPRVGGLLLFPLAFLLMVLSRVHSLTKNGLIVAYAGPGQGLVQANGRLGRIAAAGGLLAAGPGVLALKVLDATAVLYLAAIAYLVAALLNLRLPQPAAPARRPGPEDEAGRLGKLPSLAAPAIGTAGLRAAGGFLLFLLAFSLRGSGRSQAWFGIPAAGAVAGAFLGNVVAPRLPPSLREESVVLGSLAGAGAASLVAFWAFSLPLLVVFAVVAGMAGELGRLAFQSLMQRRAPGRAQGRVFVRYEVVFQLAWVGGALVPALLPISLRVGLIMLAVLYGGVALTHLRWPRPPAGRVKTDPAG